MEIDNQVSMIVNDYDVMAADLDCESSAYSGLRRCDEFAMDGIVKLEDGQRDHVVIRNSFLAGMGPLAKEIDLVAIYRNSYSTVTGQAKLEAFRIFSQAVAERRGGDANIKYGWYGGSRDEIRDIVNHGFGKRFGDSEKSCFSHGIGVYLSPATFPIHSLMRAEEDENGVRHMLLCRVILGTTETIYAGSKQLQPSSTEFDSGIDNPLKPSKYIIWSAYMNTHIFPSYIVSFTAPSLPGRIRNWRSAKKPNSPSMKFHTLMKVLSKFVPQSKMTLISKYYNEFRENEIGRPQLITRLRTLVGDRVLISVIKLCKNQRI